MSLTEPKKIKYNHLIRVYNFSFCFRASFNDDMEKMKKKNLQIKIS